MATGKRSRRRTEQNAAKDVGGQLLLSFDLLESLLPVCGGELEDAVMGPARQEAEQVAHVAERLDLVKPSAREQRNEDGVDPASSLPTKSQFRRPRTS